MTWKLTRRSACTTQAVSKAGSRNVFMKRARRKGEEGPERTNGNALVVQVPFETWAVEKLIGSLTSARKHSSGELQWNKKLGINKSST